MKNILYLLILFSFASPAIGQKPAWDSTFRPPTHTAKWQQFKSYANANTDIISLGNSIMAGTDWMELLGEPHARNRGISGDISFGIVERLDEVTEGKPAKVFILIGINDISRNIPDSFILDNYRKIIHRIKSASPTTKIYFHTLLPVNNEFTQFKNHYNKDEHILYVNDELKKLATKEGITLIDLYTPFLNANNKLDKQYTMDGLHLLPSGYRKWADILKKGKYLDK
ncbi:MAG: sialate O-acetylesterase [Chitinophagaceae bacterium]|nr:sialate O-acetylesterase [Chitinophagaceae bacterium]